MFNVSDGNVPVLVKRVGIRAYDGKGGFLKASFPLGKLALYKDKLILDCLWRKYELKMDEIDYLKGHLMGGIDIIHHCNNIPESIEIHGFFLYQALKKAIGNNNLAIKLR